MNQVIGEDFYTKEFSCGNLSISRGELESFPCPFCTQNVPDEKMQIIIHSTCERTKMRMRLPIAAEIDMEDNKTSMVWWEELEAVIVAMDIPYYEDMPDTE
jgi:hypothetical protein